MLKIKQMFKLTSFPGNKVFSGPLKFSIKGSSSGWHQLFWMFVQKSGLVLQHVTLQPLWTVHSGIWSLLMGDLLSGDPGKWNKAKVCSDSCPLTFSPLLPMHVFFCPRFLAATTFSLLNSVSLHLNIRHISAAATGCDLLPGSYWCPVHTGRATAVSTAVALQ